MTKVNIHCSICYIGLFSLPSPPSHHHSHHHSEKVDDTTEAKAAEAEEAKTAEEAKVDNNDFTVVEEEGQEKFKCNNCDLKLDKVISIKRNITSKHVVKTPGRKRKSMESAKVETNTKEAKIDDDLSDSLMEDLGSEYTSTQADIDNMDKLLDEYESKLEMIARMKQ